MYPQAQTILAVSTLFLILAWVFLVLRSYVRLCIVHKFGLDDALMVLAVFVFTAKSGLVFNGVANEGFGGRLATGNSMKWIFFCYVTETTVTKLSIGFLLLRICTTEHRAYRSIIWTVMALSSLIYIISIPLIFLQCDYQELQQPNPSCLRPSLGATGLPFSVVDIVTEWILAVLPIVMLWNVQIPRRVKVSLMVILSMGILASIACIIYTVLLARAIRQRNIYAMSGTLVWAQVKNGLGIVASSAATLRPLLREVKSTLSSRRFTRMTSHHEKLSGSHSTQQSTKPDPSNSFAMTSPKSPTSPHSPLGKGALHPHIEELDAVESRV